MSRSSLLSEGYFPTCCEHSLVKHQRAQLPLFTNTTDQGSVLEHRAVSRQQRSQLKFGPRTFGGEAQLGPRIRKSRRSLTLSRAMLQKKRNFVTKTEQSHYPIRAKSTSQAFA